jgi:hypothetical protein
MTVRVPEEEWRDTSTPPAPATRGSFVLPLHDFAAPRLPVLSRAVSDDGSGEREGEGTRVSLALLQAEARMAHMHAAMRYHHFLGEVSTYSDVGPVPPQRPRSLHWYAAANGSHGVALRCRLW